MWKLFKPMNLYGNTYDAYGDLDRTETHRLLLDNITCAKRINIKKLNRFMQLAPCLKRAYEFLTSTDGFDRFTQPRDLPKTVTAKKWRNHIDQLEKAGIIEKVNKEQLLSTAGYFAVPKSDGTARAIWNGRKISRCSNVPPPVNLPNLPDILREASQLLHNHNGVDVITGDFRHFFHQITASRNMQSYLGIAIEDDNGNLQYYKWITLPMGHSWSPWTAQAIAWALLLYKETSEEDIFETNISTSEQLPTYIHLKEGGFITVFYDNVFAIGASRRVMQILDGRLKRNFRLLGNDEPVELKHWNYLTFKELKKNPFDFLGAEIKVSAKRNSEETWDLMWRHTHAKNMQWIERYNPRTADTCRQVARICGIILWRHQLTLRPLCGIANLMHLLRTLAEKVREARSWDTTANLHQTECQLIENMWRSVETNDWEKYGNNKHTSTIFLASDSSDDKWGYVVFSNHDVICKEGFTWNQGFQHMHIFVKEAISAIEAIERTTNNKTDTLIYAVIDNTAAASALRNMYSSNGIVCKRLEQLSHTLETNRNRIEVVTVKSTTNVADPISRGHVQHESEAERLQASIKAIAQHKLGIHKADSYNLISANEFETDIRHLDTQGHPEQLTDTDMMDCTLDIHADHEHSEYIVEESLLHSSD